MATNPSSKSRTNGGGRRGLIVALVAILVLLLVAFLVFLLVRALTPQPQAVLRLMPAAAAVDDKTIVLLSGSGWRSNEQVAICATVSDADPCDADSALTVIRADRDGAIEADVLAGPLLRQGMTTFIASGIESGQIAARSFRLLKTADAPIPAATPTRQEELSGGDGSGTAVATPTSPSVPPPAGTWLGEYFANPELAGSPTLTRNDPELAFDWGLGAPDPALPVDGYSVRWSQRLPFSGGSYRFTAEANGGVRVVVDDRLVIDQWQDGGATEARSGVAELSEGEHTVIVSFVDLQDAASMALRWEVFDTFADWQGEYFATPDLSGAPALVRNDLAVDFDWGEDSPAPGLIPADGFSVRWSRTLPFAEGRYRFSITANDGARLLVDDMVVVDAWNGPSDQPVTADMQLDQGNHRVAVVLFDAAGPARITVGWSPIPIGTPTAGSAVPTVSETPVPPGQPEATPTWTPTAPPGSTPTPTLVSTPTPTPSVPPGSTATPTPTAPPGSTPTPTWTSTVPPGSTATPTPTMTPTVPPGTTATPTPTPTPLLEVGLNPPEGRIDDLITVSIGGQWAPGVTVFVILVPNGVPPYQPPSAQIVSTSASATTSNDGSAVTAQFRVPNDTRITGVQPIQLVVHTGNWSQWKAEPFTVVE